MRAFVTIIFDLDPQEDDTVKIMNGGFCEDIVDNDEDVIKEALEAVFVEEHSFDNVNIAIEE